MRFVVSLVTIFIIMPRFFKGRDIAVKKVALGQNYQIKRSVNNEIVTTPTSIHAEMDALNRLIKNWNNRERTKAINLLVIRLTKTGVLGESRPCYHCLLRLQQIGLKIKYIYYSTADGRIAREKFSTMIESDKTYISLGNRRKLLGYSSVNEMAMRKVIYVNQLLQT